MAQPDLPPPSSAGQDAQALVLIAEDEPEIAEILTAYLARGGLR
ncbi:DNA-binding response regulator, partial [Burkholderia contaminans]